MTDKVWVRLHDEAPRIGAGRRLLEVVTRGYKWTTVRYWPGGPEGHSVKHKFKTAIFDMLIVDGGA